MTQTLKLSSFGLKFIKAYEGYHPQGRKLSNGTYLIGHSHKTDEAPVGHVSREEAEALLRRDLEPVQELVLDSIFAPLNQNQFDAMVSLAFNIGRKAFKSSLVVKYLNEGQTLAAAESFEVWRKGRIGDRTIVVDALVRRRAAEKALFLRPAMGILGTSTYSLKPKATGYAPSAAPVKVEIADDGVVDTLHTETLDEDIAQDGTPTVSPIAEAAAEVSGRLDRLVDDMSSDEPSADEDDDLSIPRPGANDVTITHANDTVDVEGLDTYDALNFDDDDTEHAPSPEKYVTLGDAGADDDDAPSGGVGPNLAFFFIGLFLMLGGGYYTWKASAQNLSGVVAYLAPFCTILGIILMMGALFYLIRAVIHRGD